MACARSKDSDQLGHPSSLIRVFTVCIKKAWVLSYLLSVQWRFWSDWAGQMLLLVLSWGGSSINNLDFNEYKISEVYTAGWTCWAEAWTCHCNILHCSQALKPLNQGIFQMGEGKLRAASMRVSLRTVWLYSGSHMSQQSWKLGQEPKMNFS